MYRFQSILLVCVGVVGAAGTAVAQLPLPKPGGGSSSSSGNLQRLPNDQVEGTVYEYKGTLDKTSKSQGDDQEIEGKFRLENSAIFDVSPTVKLPSQKEAGNPLQKILSGKGGNVKAPEAPQQKRLGEFKKTTGSQLRLEFDDEESLFGTMMLNREKGTQDVWVGTFTERKDGRAGRIWRVKVRPIED